MLRLLSIVLVLVGLLAAGLGGAALLERAAPRSMDVETTMSAAEAPADTAAAPVATIETPISDAAADAPPPAAAPSEEDVLGVESVTSEPETGFSFQTEMEPGPSVIAPGLDQAGATAPAAPAGPTFEERLKSVPVAHETPANAEYKRAFDVTFAIDATGGASAADALPGRGRIEEGEAKVSDRVEVRLSGASFNIVAASPPVQSLSPLTENTWRWSVTPITAGEHDLVFEVFAIDADAVTPLRTFQDTVTVKVSGLNRAIEFADQANPLFVLLGGIGSALAGLFGAIKFFGKR